MFKGLTAMHHSGKHNILLLVLFILFTGGKINAAEQKDSTEKKQPYDRSLVLGLDYSSDRVFYGSRRGERVVYASPYLFYEARSGFFTGVSTYRLIKPERYWDNTQLMAGWDFTLFKKITAYASYSRFAYSDSSDQVQSTLKNNVEVSFLRDSVLIQPKLTGGIYFGNASPDYVLTFEFAHEFCFEGLFKKNGDGLYIRPAAMISAGTLHYERLLKSDSARLLIPKKEVTRFDVSGIDFSLPFEYDIGRFIIGVSANYNIPLNQPKYLDVKPGFYFTTGIGFRIVQEKTDPEIKAY